MWHWFDGMGWWMIFGGLWSLAFWVAIIVLVVWAVNRLTTSRGTGTAPRGTMRREPLDIAKERYASGEISREDFEQIKKDLA